jgi:hypothetical protein
MGGNGSFGTGRWRIDNNFEIERLAKETIGAPWQEAAAIEHGVTVSLMCMVVTGRGRRAVQGALSIASQYLSQRVP